ncbi:urea transporter [Pseudomonas sp. MS19]|uniref:urea transporter n=1 Tax=Pseudomonas sp. MS19 TaxID=2579939 RepID=UPI0015626ECF|nr:urea transporter [Pseudomonas sp. MS19]NRH26895.1 urea transporter [Pseudomonas sp. MS19]
MQPITEHTLSGFRALLNGFSQIFLQANPRCGLLVLLALCTGAPDLLGGALLGGLCSMLTAQRRGYPAADISQGLYGYNGILLGILITSQFNWSPLNPLLIMFSAGASSLLLAPWMARMRKRRWLPAFTCPFVLLGWLVLQLADPLQLEVTANATDLTHQLNWPTALSAVARGLGQVIFIDRPLAGICLLLGLLIADRRAALWALIGTSAGLAFALLQGWEQHSALAGLFGYNAVLTAIAVSQVNRGACLPVIGIVLALLLQPGFSSLGLPALTMPFILACWLLKASQRLLKQSANDCAPVK